MNNSMPTVLISSCDSYQDTWIPQFTLLDRYWPDVRQLPIVLSTETLTFKYEGMNILCPQLYVSNPDPRSVTWSRLLRETLEKAVHTELVLIHLDDYFLLSNVDTHRLEICCNYMIERKNIACISLVPVSPPYTATTDYPWLVKRAKNAPYLFSLMTGLWRKDRLLHFLRDHENPWYFERWGSLRARRYPDDFYAALAIDKHPIFDFQCQAYGISSGLWYPGARELFAKENINIDLSIRGIMPEVWKAPVCRRNWFKTAWNIFRSLMP